MTAKLLTPIQLRSITARNRIVISPMCTYSATNGMVDDWHLAHLGKFALGGAGIVFVEATAVEARGRITHGDVGIWSDAHGKALGRIAAFLKTHGALPALQLAHAGRKASMARPWFGNAALTADDIARGDTPWEIVGPCAEPMEPGWIRPKAMERTDIDAVIAAFVAGAKRGIAAGFEIVEVHGAHGYLISNFLSPISNKRTDGYGGDRAGRMRFALEVVDAVRAVWPADKPLFFRTSSVDGVDGGWQLDDTVELARALKARGVDVVDCSSGGIAGSATAGTLPRGLGFQVPFAARVRRDVGIATQAVGLILDGPQAEAILQAGDADLIAIGRQALVDPFWARHAARALGDDSFAEWPQQYGWWLERRTRALARILRESA
jgi:2,4-dienoyl-CoA reductase-like NADH-dependent reductase (Old Yellow Enzyme family)